MSLFVKHTYLPTTLITDKGITFTSKLVSEIAQFLGIQIKSANTKHPQTIGKLERTHASLKTNLKMASRGYRRRVRDISSPAIWATIWRRSHGRQKCRPSGMIKLIN